MTTRTTPIADVVAAGAWQIDPARSSVEFHVRHFYGLMTVKGHFDRYDGTLDLSGGPAVTLVIEADSLDTGNKRRDEHLRSDDFFDVTDHPRVRFDAATATVDGNLLRASGQLQAAGRSVPLEVTATVTEDGGELVLEASADVDHRELGMTWSPLGILRAPSTLRVSARLLRA